MEPALDAGPARRRWSLTVLLAAFLLFSLAGWVRMLSSIERWYWLNFAGVAPGPLYLAITGGLWGVTGLAALAWVGLRRQGWRLAGSAAALFMALTYWADRLLFMDRGGSLPNEVFAGVLTVLGLGFALVTLRPWKEG
jgi:hypothetical protein